MRDLFPGWVPPDEETLDYYWREATFAVDANVLLDLYRFSEQARTGLLTALRSFEERLWIPHQVGLEFHHHRFGVLLAQREAEDNLLAGLDQIKEELKKQLGQRLSGAGRRDLDPLKDAIDAGFERLRENLKEAEKAHTKGLGESIRDDPIYEDVEALCAGRVGAPFDAERQASVIADAEDRISQKIPPGYLDADKEGEEQFGDVILWHQLCLHAEETKRPVVLITDDQKEDWVWEVRGKVLGPRPELVAEMQERGGNGFHLYTPTRFLEVWEQRDKGREVEPEVLAELASSSEDAVSAQFFTAAGRHVRELWEQSGREGQAFHEVKENQVELLLHYHPLSSPDDYPVAIATVLGPEEATRAVVHPMTVDRSQPNFQYLLRYPMNFPQARFAPGSYEVVWSIVMEEEDVPLPPREVARDRFLIP
jgi:hypothetical protein